MIKPIMRDVMFLSQPSENATTADRQVITDLVDLPEREHPDWDALLERHEAQCTSLLTKA